MYSLQVFAGLLHVQLLSCCSMCTGNHKEGGFVRCAQCYSSFPIDAVLIAGKTLRALALKAAAEASVAASVPPVPAGVSQTSTDSQSAGLVNTVEQQGAMPKAEEPGRVTLAGSCWTRVVT